MSFKNTSNLANALTKNEPLYKMNFRKLQEVRRAKNNFKIVKAQLEELKN
jgi:hypothetical protein